jgi:hypothetical protein
MAVVLRFVAVALVALVVGCAKEELPYQPDERHFTVIEDTGRCQSGGQDVFCSRTLAVRAPDDHLHCTVEILTNAIEPAQENPFFSNASGYRVTDYPSRCSAENGDASQDVRVQLWSRTRGPYGPGPAWTDLTVRATLLDLNSAYLRPEHVMDAIRYCESQRPMILAHMPSRVRVPADREIKFRPDSACAAGQCRDCYCNSPERHYYNVIDEIDDNTPGCECENSCK